MQENYFEMWHVLAEEEASRTLEQLGSIPVNRFQSELYCLWEFLLEVVQL